MTVRHSARATVGWAFGISLSILFVSLWGRALVTDTDALGAALAPLAGAETVVDFVADWMAEEFVDSGVDPDLVAPTVEHLLESSSVGQSLGLMVVEVVEAAASPDPAGSSIDMRGLMMPAVPEVTAGLTHLGLVAGEGEIRSVVEGFDPLVIRQPGSDAIVGTHSPTAGRLGTASLLAAMALLGFGFLYVRLADDRLQALRGLLNRVAVGGLSFAVLLRLGSWVVDPDGGRAPLPDTISNLAAAKWLVPLQIAMVAAAIGAVLYLVRGYLKRGGASPPGAASATPQPERSRSLSRSR